MSYVPPKLVIWTDGSCLRNPDGPGGWAFVAVRGEEVVHIGHGAVPSTTNNRMEMMAAIEAVRFVKEFGSTIMSDSRYLTRGVNEWMLGWSKRGWLKYDGRPVINADLWMELRDEVSRARPAFRWVKGHSALKFNELADETASKAARLKI